MTASPGSGATDASFVGAIPDVYERLMVPMIFAEPAEVLADAISALDPADVLETAAGTGVLTRALRRRLPDARITATDLNEPMLARAEQLGGADEVEWRPANAQDLPFPDGSFDVVACQFGAMFFPDKPGAHSEAKRVLRSGGRFLFNVWDRIEHNEVPDVITRALVAATPDDPLNFMSRTPHGYFDLDQVRADVVAGGLVVESVEAYDGVSRTTAVDGAIAFCQGTPLRAEIHKHPTMSIEAATALATRALLERFGPGPVEAPIRWFQVTARSGDAQA